MAISQKMVAFAERSSWIRKMFEQGGNLKARFGADNVFDFSLGNPDLPPPPQFKEVMQRMVEEEGPGRHTYMPNNGYPFVREKVAEQIGKEQGVKLSANELIMTCGAAGALNVVMKSLLDPGDEVILLAPYFVEYNFYVDNHGGVAKVVNTDAQFNLDLKAIEKAISPRTKAVILNSPNNPTGQIYPAETLLALGKVLEAHSRKNGQAIYLLSDEPYRKIVYDNAEVPSIFLSYTNSLVLSSYSKDLSLPGERIGFIAVHPQAEEKNDLLGAMTLANRILGFVNAPALMQRIVAELQGTMVDCTIYAQRRQVFMDILDRQGYEYVKPKGAFYFFPKSPLENDVDFVALLLEEKILAVPGRGFGAPGYFRLAYCVDDKVIEKAADGFGRAMAKAKSVEK